MAMSGASNMRGTVTVFSAFYACPLSFHVPAAASGKSLAVPPLRATLLDFLARARQVVRLVAFVGCSPSGPGREQKL